MKSGKITKNDLIQWLKIHQKNFLVTERVAHHQPELLCDQSKEIKNIKEALFLPGTSFSIIIGKIKNGTLRISSHQLHPDF